MAMKATMRFRRKNRTVGENRLSEVDDASEETTSPGMAFTAQTETESEQHRDRETGRDDDDEDEEEYEEAIGFGL